MQDRDLPENINAIGNPEMDTTLLINVTTKLFSDAFPGGIPEEKEEALRQLFDSPEIKQLLLEARREEDLLRMQLEDREREKIQKLIDFVDGLDNSSS